MKTKRLLILSCSARKTGDETAPAIERYLSPAFFVLRRFLRNHPDHNTVVWILSAKYGLIPSNRETVHYDLAMTPERAAQLAGKIGGQFKNLYHQSGFASRQAESAFIHLPKNYLDAMRQSIAFIRKFSRVQIASGRPGEKSQQLKNWLEEGK